MACTWRWVIPCPSSPGSPPCASQRQGEAYHRAPLPEARQGKMPSAWVSSTHWILNPFSLCRDRTQMVTRVSSQALSCSSQRQAPSHLQSSNPKTRVHPFQEGEDHSPSAFSEEPLVSFTKINVTLYEVRRVPCVHIEGLACKRFLWHKARLKEAPRQHYPTQSNAEAGG